MTVPTKTNGITARVWKAMVGVRNARFEFNAAGTTVPRVDQQPPRGHHPDQARRGHHPPDGVTSVEQHPQGVPGVEGEVGDDRGARGVGSGTDQVAVVGDDAAALVAAQQRDEAQPDRRPRPHGQRGPQPAGAPDPPRQQPGQGDAEDGDGRPRPRRGRPARRRAGRSGCAPATATTPTTRRRAGPSSSKCTSNEATWYHHGLATRKARAATATAVPRRWAAHTAAAQVTASHSVATMARSCSHSSWMLWGQARPTRATGHMASSKWLCQKG